MMNVSPKEIKASGSSTKGVTFATLGKGNIINTAGVDVIGEQNINRDVNNTQIKGETIITGALDIDITVDVASMVNAVDNIKNLPENLKEIGKKIEAAGKAVVVAKEKLSEALAKLSAAEQKQVNEQVGAILLASNDKYFAAGLEVDEEYRKELAKIPQSDYEARTELQTKHGLKKQVIEAARLEKEQTIISNAAAFIKGEEGMVVDPKTGLHVPYWDRKDLNDKGGKWTIGYGTVIGQGIKEDYLDNNYINGITEQTANEHLQDYIKQDLQSLQNSLSDNFNKLEVNQTIALLSLRYNTGASAFERTDLKQMLLGKGSPKKQYNNIEQAWTDWSQPERRKREAALFKGGEFKSLPVKNWYKTKEKTNKLLGN